MRAVCISLAILLLALPVAAQDYILEKAVIGGGGGMIADENVAVQFTLCQTLFIPQVESDLNVYWGYWFWSDAYTGVEDELPKFIFELRQNYPNPFNPVTRIPYAVGGFKPVFVTLAIYDVQGKLIRQLENESKSPGTYTCLWDGKNNAGRSVSSGIYFYQIRTADFKMTKKLVLLR